jgi:SnoaL-like domain
MTLRIEDRLAIIELVGLHGHLMDNGEFDRLGELFSTDAGYDLTDFGAGVLHGIEAIREAALALGDGNPVGHHVTNIVIGQQQADGSVPVRSKGIGIAKDGTTGSVVYIDEVRQEPAGWRITFRAVIARRQPLGG